MRTLFLALLLGCTAVQAQTVTDHYIELSVTDTLSMRTKRITYDFVPQPAEMSADAVYEENTDWEKAQRKIEQESKERKEKLMKDLLKEGFRVMDATPLDGGYTITTYEDAGEAGAVRVEMSTEAELKRLVTYLRANSKGDGHVSAWEYEPGGSGEVELMQRLYAKAAAQAGALATLGGRKLGKLVNAHAPGEEKSGENSFLNLIAEFGRRELMKEGMGNMPGMLSGRERTMVFRFALAD